MTEQAEEKPAYVPELWRAQSDKGHVMHGPCPCGADHELIDRDEPAGKKRVK